MNHLTPSIGLHEGSLAHGVDGLESKDVMSGRHECNMSAQPFKCFDQHSKGCRQGISSVPCNILPFQSKSCAGTTLQREFRRTLTGGYNLVTCCPYLSILGRRGPEMALYTSEQLRDALRVSLVQRLNIYGSGAAWRWACRHRG